MKNQTLLFVMNERTTDAQVREYATRAATHDTRLVCLILSMMPTLPLNAFGTLPYSGIDAPTGWIDEMNATRKRMKERGDEIEAILQSEGASGDVQAAQCVLADVRALVARRALVSDLVAVSQNLRADDADIFRAAIYGALFESPIPLILNAPPLPRPKRVFIAWNTELPASRAIHAALPILKGASEVFVGSFDPDATETHDGENPGSDLAKWLSHHGCTVTVNQYPSGGEDVGTCIRRRAAEVGADLVVMGAFGRSRLQELVFGGTTHSMLEQNDTPVLMAH